MGTPRASRRRAPVKDTAFVLGAQCTLREAEALKTALTAAEDSSGDFLVDGGAVERIDTAGLQLLVAFTARLALLGRRLQWKSASPALRDGASQLGLATGLGL